MYGSMYDLPYSGMQQQQAQFLGQSFLQPHNDNQGGHQGINPLMMLSPLAFGLSHSPKTAMSMISPAFGIANLLGAFK